MLRKRKLPAYNDGIIEVCRERRRETSFSARLEPTRDDLEPVVTLCYAECSRREQDFEAAERMDYSLSLKVKTYDFPDVDAGCMAIVAGRIYDIEDVQRSGREMYLYLGGGRDVRPR